MENMVRIGPALVHQEDIQYIHVSPGINAIEFFLKNGWTFNLYQADYPEEFAFYLELCEQAPALMTLLKK